MRPCVEQIKVGLILQYGSLHKALILYQNGKHFPKEERIVLTDYAIMVNPMHQPYPNDV